MYTNEHEFIDRYLDELLAMTQIGSWEWQAEDGKMVYSSTWANILGCKVDELEQTVKTWESKVLPEDLDYVQKEIDKHFSGEKDRYEAEFRMVRKDGSIIWVQEKGKITDRDENGKPLRFVGVLQDVTKIKEVEQQLRENQKTLDLAVSVGGLGTCDWDIPNNKVRYNDEFLTMLGYTQDEILGVVEEWSSMIYPEDLARSMVILEEYMSGKTSKYECEIRMQHKDGRLIWTRNMAQIAARDANGVPTRLIGGHLNIDALKRSEERFAETLKELEHHREFLEKEIENRTKTLTEQDKMLWAVNEISQNLFSVDNLDDIDDLIKISIDRYCEACGRDRVALWKNKVTDDGVLVCSQIYEALSKDNSSKIYFEKLIEQEDRIQMIKEIAGRDLSDSEMETILDDQYWGEIPYKKCFPSIHQRFMAGKSLNILTKDLSPIESLRMRLRGIKTFLITPIILNDEIWGFVSCDNCQKEELFTEVEEKMLSIVGFFLASSIRKNESEKKMREAEERVQLMLDATPLCCNLWTPEFKNMNCNEEAVRLFELSSQQEYLDRFFELSPEYQPCGRLTSEMAIENITKAFKEGFCKFEWVHQKLDGTPIPSEITLVRIKYKNGYIVAGYTRDLRELKAMLAKLQAKEDDLRAARDEALLSSKAKSNFLANMSHEIRTPMNAISGFAEIILRECKDKQSAEYAIGIKNACSNLLNIVNDILDISKIESGKLEIINSQYELASLLNDVIAISRMRLGSKSLIFTTYIDSKLPAILMGDEIRIKQILINLLSNAIKFTEKGSIALRVYGEVKGNKAYLQFEVEDTGFGIKKEDLVLLFAEFERINTTKNRSIEGTGLGLAISKQLCEMMGGEIDVHSVYGKGSIFTVRIAQDCQEYEQLSKVATPKAVLVYESREVYLRSITETIENLGCRCVPCSNQSQLIDNIHLMKYDFVLTSSMHLEKIKSIIRKNILKTTVVVFADYGENINDDTVRTIFLPLNCLQMSDILNGKKGEFEFGTYNGGEYSFVAPTAKVLLVDDNAVNLKVAAGLMAPYQFSIDTAENGIIAVEKIKNNHYDLVFMDHMMPEMDGIDATIEVRRLSEEYYRKLPIIALTANALVGTREMFIREGMNDFLAKPIEISKLGQILSKWLPNSKKIAILKQNEENEILEIETLECEIAGVNVEQGILSVGGNKDDYLQILASYYTDANDKCASIFQHFTDKNIADFRIQVHALKSTSATIGAMELSAMAAKLEAAAIEKNLEFIDSNIHQFLLALQNTLEAIAPLVNSNGVLESTKANETLIPGDLAVLCNELEKLHEAAEFANISQIDEILLKLNEFYWPEEVLKEFSDIRACVAMFDYDGVIECIERLQQATR